MSNKTFKTEDLSQKELAEMWHNSEKKRVKYQQENRRLKKDSEYWRKEAEKMTRIANKRRDEMINIAHNYAKMENHFGSNVMVHRKGATLARKDTIGKSKRFS